MTIRPETDDLIAFLNSLVAIDRYAVAELLAIRVPCNEEMANHPTVQVAAHGSATFIRPGTHRLGLLGVLNGFCGAYDAGSRQGYGAIAANYEDGHLTGFTRLGSD